MRLKSGVKIVGIALLVAFLVIALVGTGKILTFFFFSVPSESTVKREFLDRYPNAAIRNAELIFEQDASVVYLITAKRQGAADEAKYDFALKRSGVDWRWCDDQTERKCGPIGR